MESNDSFQRICRRLTHLNNEGFTIMTRMLLTLCLLIATTVDSVMLLTKPCLSEASGWGLACSVRCRPEGNVYRTCGTTCWETLRDSVIYQRWLLLGLFFLCWFLPPKTCPTSPIAPTHPQLLWNISIYSAVVALVREVCFSLQSIWSYW